MDVSTDDYGPPPRYRAPLRFTQTELKRALRAAKQAGPEFALRVDADGSMIFCNVEALGMKSASKSKPVRDFVL